MTLVALGSKCRIDLILRHITHTHRLLRRADRSSIRSTGRECSDIFAREHIQLSRKYRVFSLVRKHEILIRSSEHIALDSRLRRGLSAECSVCLAAQTHDEDKEYVIESEHRLLRDKGIGDCSRMAIGSVEIDIEQRSPCSTQRLATHLLITSPYDLRGDNLAALI